MRDDFGDNIFYGHGLTELLGRAVADVGVLEDISRAIGGGGQRIEGAGVGQLIDIDHIDAGIEHKVPHDGRADEARPPR